MDRNQPPDEDPLDARESFDIEKQELSSEELRRAAELVLQAHGVAPRSDTSEGLDHVALAIYGGILIGGILAARVTRFGSVEFAEGIPDKLSDVVRASLELRPS